MIRKVACDGAGEKIQFTCVDCPVCLPALEPGYLCTNSRTYTEDIDIKCISSKDGFYCEDDVLPCKKCTSCANHKVEKNCDVDSNHVCRSCWWHEIWRKSLCMCWLKFGLISGLFWTILLCAMIMMMMNCTIFHQLFLE